MSKVSRDNACTSQVAPGLVWSILFVQKRYRKLLSSSYIFSEDMRPRCRLPAPSITPINTKNHPRPFLPPKLQHVKVHSQATKHERSLSKCHMIWHWHSELVHFFLKVLLPSSSPCYLINPPASPPYLEGLHKERPSEGRLIKYVSIVFLMSLSNMLLYSFWCGVPLAHSNICSTRCDEWSHFCPSSPVPFSVGIWELLCNSTMRTLLCWLQFVVRTPVSLFNRPLVL